MISQEHNKLSLVGQCQLLGISRSSVYYHPRPESPENLEIMRILDEQYMKTPFYGVPKMTIHLQEKGFCVNPKRVRRLEEIDGTNGYFPRP